MYGPSSELRLPQPLSRKRLCPPPPRTKGWVGTLACGWGVGESQFRRLEKKLCTLPTLWPKTSNIGSRGLQQAAWCFTRSFITRKNLAHRARCFGKSRYKAKDPLRWKAVFRIRIQMNKWIRIQAGQNFYKKRKNYKSSCRDGDFFWSLNVLFWRSIRELYDCFWSKILLCHKITLVWNRIRIGSGFSLDLDPDIIKMQTLVAGTYTNSTWIWLERKNIMEIRENKI